MEGGTHLNPGHCIEMVASRKPKLDWCFTSGGGWRGPAFGANWQVQPAGTMQHWGTSISASSIFTQVTVNRDGLKTQLHPQTTLLSRTRASTSVLARHQGPCANSACCCCCSPCFAVLLPWEHTKLRDLRNQLNHGNQVQNTFNSGGSCAAGDTDVPPDLAFLGRQSPQETQELSTNYQEPARPQPCSNLPM